MNTPAHLLCGPALFGRRRGKATLWAATVGSLLPDLSLYVLVYWALQVQGLGPDVVFGETYYSREWQRIFAVDNSLLLWGLLLALALWRRADWAIALCAAALLHIGLDFLMHAGDGRPNFWPLTDWVFVSPVSYWDSAHHAHLVAPVTLLASMVAFVVLWRHCRWSGRALFGALLAAELWTSWQMFTYF